MNAITSTAEGRRDYQRRYYQLHRDKMREYQRIYNMTHKKPKKTGTHPPKFICPREAVKKEYHHHDLQKTPVGDRLVDTLNKIIAGDLTLVRVG